MQNLLPNLNLLQQQLEAGLPSEKIKQLFFRLDYLPYALSAAHESLLEFVSAEWEAVESVNFNKDGVSTTTLISGDKLRRRIDSFLEAAIRAQNGIIPYIKDALHMNLPSSLRDLYNKTEKLKINLPTNIRTLILSYWKSQGERLRDYRDFSQHYGLVSSEVQVRHSQESPPAISLILPNNPKVRSMTKLSYDEPRVFAHMYLVEQLLHLIRFCHNVVTSLTLKPVGTQRVASFKIVPRVPIEIHQGGFRFVGHGLVSLPQVRSDIARFTATLERL